jgi:N6-adenosine-specific RNA methylase IME4
MMSDSDIAELKVPSAKNCMLFLWCNNAKLRQGIEIMTKWGFKYKTNMVWIKTNRFGLGYYVRGQHELLLIGEKGHMPVPQEKNRPVSVLNAKPSKHSEKPKEIFDIIECMYPNRTYIELFARNKPYTCICS